MIGNGSARLILTALFVVLGAWYLAAAVRALSSPGKDRGRQALGSALHALLSAAMISMFWSWGAEVPVIAQVTVFTAAAGWFAGQAIFCADGHRGTGSSANWYHAGLMTVMVWMPVAMELISSPTPVSGTGGMSMPDGDTAGMVMDGPVTAGAWGAATGMPGAGSPGPVSLVLAAALFAAAAWQAVAALGSLAAPAEGRPPGQAGRDGAGVPLRNGIGALMAAGMAIALLEMA